MTQLHRSRRNSSPSFPSSAKRLKRRQMNGSRVPSTSGNWTRYGFSVGTSTKAPGARWAAPSA
eukprot:6706850-Prymnesium_polylepis.1